jgi:hypothetical protein
MINRDGTEVLIPGSTGRTTFTHRDRTTDPRNTLSCRDQRLAAGPLPVDVDGRGWSILLGASIP